MLNINSVICVYNVVLIYCILFFRMTVYRLGETRSCAFRIMLFVQIFTAVLDERINHLNRLITHRQVDLLPFNFIFASTIPTHITPETISVGAAENSCEVGFQSIGCIAQLHHQPIVKMPLCFEVL